MNFVTTRAQFFVNTAFRDVASYYVQVVTDTWRKRKVNKSKAAVPAKAAAPSKDLPSLSAPEALLSLCDDRTVQESGARFPVNQILSASFVSVLI